jgi:sterol desaturase/sphingolipid hydroxylase (fatty acid hydroxylase superfamily)
MNETHISTHRHPWLWLAVVAATAVASGLALATGHGLVVSATLPVALVVFLALLELAMVRDPARSWRNDPQLACDVGHALLGGWLAERVGAVIVTTAAAAAATQIPAALILWPGDLPLPVQAAMLILAAEGLEYLRHRWLHADPRAWLFHRLHHDASRMHVLKAPRSHFVDMSLRFVLVFAPLALLGAPAELFPAYVLAMACTGPISHSGFTTGAPAWLHRVLVTPEVHAIHHARAAEYQGANLAPVLPLFDILGGTFRAPENSTGVSFGIDEAAPDTFVRQLLSPFRELLARRPAVGAARTGPEPSA